MIVWDALRHLVVLSLEQFLRDAGVLLSRVGLDTSRRVAAPLCA